jgi:23S rRNA U2552 (ribose-2'-O)-methylase RlmE/FtsJ
MMIHFQIPRNNPNIYKFIEPQYIETIPGPVISNSLSFYLGDIKKRINNREQEWDSMKRYTNPCEYIHTIVPGKKKSVAKRKPLSRSYFKMIELVNYFKLLEKSKSDVPLNSFHLAEGPGGFIEALAHIRNNDEDKYIGMSILDDANDTSIPAWKKSKQFLQDYPQVYIENGIDETGDILSLVNLEYCRNKYGNTMDIITGDGGFDFSIDFNNQEHSIGKLLYGQVIYALVMQKPGGSFILKLFDCFMSHTLDMLALLSSMYEKVFITKPQTSRFANSEKYIVCKNFIGNNAETIYPYLESSFKSILQKEQNMFRLLNISLPLLFTTKIEEYNAIFGQQQIENIHYTLSLMDCKNQQEKLNTLVKTNVKKSMEWCVRYNVLFNNISFHNNSFTEQEQSIDC